MTLLRVVPLLLCVSFAFAQNPIEVSQSFDIDPAWESFNNRVIGENCPTIKQDFGYSGKPEIGGVVSRTRTPAYYAMKIPPLSMFSPMSASGKIRIMLTREVGGAYFGFFNSTRQEWRPWSSMAVRIADAGGPPTLQPTLIFDYMTGGWKAGGFDVGAVPADGTVHRWRFSYDPDAVVPKAWPDERLRTYMDPQKRRPIEEILAAAQKAEPDATKQSIEKRLFAARDLGLATFHTRRGVGWEIRREPDKVKGKMSMQIDENLAVSNFLDITHRDDPAITVMDRFGIFNFQLPGQSMEFYLSDLVVNGTPIDLSKDPQWDAKGNRTQFVEQDFHAKQNFGYSATTNFAGGRSPGEIGGTFWRTEPVDPLHGFYAVEIGKLTNKDPIKFSGRIAFTGGATDAGMFFGYFNKADKMVELKGMDESGAPLPNMMGFAIDGPTRIGYFFGSEFTPKDRRLSNHGQGPIFVPDHTPHDFTFAYDPTANKSEGQIVFTLDGETYKHNLTKEQQASGAAFTHFGLLNIRRGGKYVEVYLDDLEYTTRQLNPAQHEQMITKVPYPAGGRKY